MKATATNHLQQPAEPPASIRARPRGEAGVGTANTATDSSVIREE